MFLQTEVTVFDTTSNSTPWFLVPASIFLPANTPWQYNPLPFDQMAIHSTGVYLNH
jgi:hypothetical protein